MSNDVFQVTSNLLSVSKECSDFQLLPSFPPAACSVRVAFVRRSKAVCCMHNYTAAHPQIFLPKSLKILSCIFALKHSSRFIKLQLDLLH